MENAFQQGESSIFVDKQKYQMIKQSLQNNNEVPYELDSIIEQDYLQNSSDRIESINDYFLISKKLWNNNEFNRSFQYMQRSLQLAEFYRGTSHKEFYQCLDLLGQHLLAQGRLFEAQFYFERALNCVIQDKGPFHEDVVYYQKQLAYMYTTQGKLKQALELYEDSLRIQQTYNPLYCINTLDTILRINLIQYKQSQNKQQLKEDLKWILSQIENSKKDPISDQFKLQIVYEQALISISEKNYEEAELHLNNYLSKQEDPSLLIEAKLNLGYIELMRKNHTKSYEIYQDYQKMIQNPQNKYLKQEQQIQNIVKSI